MWREWGTGSCLSKVDEMYFKAIVRGLKNRGVVWTVAVRTPDSYEKNRPALVVFGVPSEPVLWNLWSDMCSCVWFTATYDEVKEALEGFLIAKY